MKYSNDPQVQALIEDHLDEAQNVVSQAAADITGWGNPRSDDFGDILDDHGDEVWDTFISFVEEDIEEIDVDDSPFDLAAKNAVETVVARLRGEDMEG